MTYRHRMRNDQIALQLYTLRRLAAVDLPGTLQAVAAAGFRAVELAGLPETGPGELARLLHGAGLRVVAAHESIEGLRADASAVADRLAEIGGSPASLPWIAESAPQTPAYLRRI